MILIPAIDLQNGRCVRLRQGHFSKVTPFDVSPVERASYYAGLGAKKLHLVDLDGAKTGGMQQLELICAMQNAGVCVQAGGGIRSLEQARLCLSSGISNIVLGSIAITSPIITKKMIQEIKPENIIIALDVHITNQTPTIAINGWQKATNSRLWDVVSYYQEFGINQILCTDIACDGMMQGPSFSLYKEAVERFPNIKWQASGGIRNKEDIDNLNQIGISAAILGLTLYQNTFNFAEMLQEYKLC